MTAGTTLCSSARRPAGIAVLPVRRGGLPIVALPIVDAAQRLLGGGGEEPRERFEIFCLGQEQDAITGPQFERAAGPGRRPVPDDERDPRMLAEREVADRVAGRSRAGPPRTRARLGFFAEPDRQLPRQRGPFADRDGERSSDKRYECPLADDRDEHDDEHDPVHVSAPATPPRTANAASRIGTAPFRPLQVMNARSAQLSRARPSVRRTTSGRASRASTSASTMPSSQTRPESPLMSIVRPSATKTTSSARLASEPEKRSISPLYGMRASPRNRPAMKTARKPEPCASEVAP